LAAQQHKDQRATTLRNTELESPCQCECALGRRVIRALHGEGYHQRVTINLEKAVGLERDGNTVEHRDQDRDLGSAAQQKTIRATTV
jgi:hypothetical protein